MRPPLSKDTRLCISLAARPSNIGTRFHNHLYDVLGLDYVYKAFTTTDIAAAIGGVRALGIRGCSVSMPFKEDVIPLVDVVEDSATVIGSVNTIVNDDGRLTASNTDYIAVRRLVDPRWTAPRSSSAAAAGWPRPWPPRSSTPASPRARSSRATRRPAGSWPRRWGSYAAALASPTASLIVNATPIGMGGGPQSADLAFPRRRSRPRRRSSTWSPCPLTPLVVAARAAGKQVITGAEVIALQAAEQFEKYTGVRPTPEQVAEASAVSRA